MIERYHHAMSTISTAVKDMPMSEKAPAIITPVAGGLTFVAGLSLNEWLAVIGGFCAIASLAWNIHVSRKNLKIRIAEAKAKGADVSGI